MSGAPLTRWLKENPGYLLFSVGILCAGAFFFVYGEAGSYRATKRFEREGEIVRGVIVELHPEDHDQVLVEFEVDGAHYRTLSEAPRPARYYRAGEHVDVFYFRSSPADGMCIKPEWSAAGMVVMSCLFLGLLVPMLLIAPLVGASFPEDSNIWRDAG